MPPVVESVRTDRLGPTIFLLQLFGTRCLAVLRCFDKKLLHSGGLALVFVQRRRTTARFIRALERPDAS